MTVQISNLKEQFLSNDRSQILLEHNNQITDRIDQLKSIDSFMQWLNNNGCTPADNENNLWEYTFLYLLFKVNLPVQIKRIPQSQAGHADFKVSTGHSTFIIELKFYHLTKESIEKYNRFNQSTTERLNIPSNMGYEIIFELFYSTLTFGLDEIAKILKKSIDQVNISANNIKDENPLTKIVMIDASQFIPDWFINNQCFITFLCAHLNYDLSGKGFTECRKRTNDVDKGKNIQDLKVKITELESKQCNEDNSRLIDILKDDFDLNLTKLAKTFNMLRSELYDNNISLIINFDDLLKSTNDVHKSLVLMPALDKDIVKLVQLHEIFDNKTYTVL